MTFNDCHLDAIDLISINHQSLSHNNYNCFPFNRLSSAAAQIKKVFKFISRNNVADHIISTMHRFEEIRALYVNFPLESVFVVIIM